ncbi:MAG: M48 family metalloprotease [Campylobacterota bacterium]
MGQLKVILLFILQMLIFSFLGFYFAGVDGLLISFLLINSLNIYAYYYCDKFLLEYFNAIPLDNFKHPVYEIIDDLVSKTNTTMPRVYLISDNTPNAFSTGRNSNDASLVITTGLYDLLNKKEIEGVIAHELGHINNNDILINSLVAYFSSLIAYFPNKMKARYSKDMLEDSSLFFFLNSIFTPISSIYIKLFNIKRSDILADDYASSILKDVSFIQASISALSKLSNRALLLNSSLQTSHLFTINPYFDKEEMFMNSFLSSCVSAEQRVIILENKKSTP